MKCEKMSKQEKMQALRRAYNIAKAANLCNNMVEFALLCNISRNSFSQAINGNERYLSDNLLFKVEKRLQEKGICIYGDIKAETISGGNVAQVQNLTQPDHTADFLAEIKAQRELYAAHTEKYMQQLANLTQALTALANRK